MFLRACKKKLLVENPFAELKLPSQVNKARQQFIDHAKIAKVIEAAPDHDWRCIIALARFGGLRTPSETLTLKWSDIDWSQGRITIRSPKLEHFASGGTRQIPLFPELRQYLQDALDAAPDGAVYVVNRYRDPDVNLRTTFLKIIDRAGVKPWGRLYHNLRSSRQTELQEYFPSHVVASWLGNSPRTADAHYNQVRDSDFTKAAGSALHWALHHSDISRCPKLSGGSEGNPHPAKNKGKQHMRTGDNRRDIVQYPRQESNLPLDLRRVVCYPTHPEDG